MTARTFSLLFTATAASLMLAVGAGATTHRKPARTLIKLDRRTGSDQPRHTKNELSTIVGRVARA